MSNADALDSMIVEERDWNFDILAVQTLLKSYLGRLRKGKDACLMETPQYMFLRVATYLMYPDLVKIKEVYESLSKGKYIQASPTLFNSGWHNPQLSSCFLLTVNDSLKSIKKLWGDVATISKNSGGIGIDITSLRHSEIGQNWFINKGIVPWIRILENILVAIDQCFHPDTIVYTKNGPKAIGDIIPGDNLITSDGSLGEVVKCLHHNLEGMEEMYEFSIKHSQSPIIVAGCHPFLAVMNNGGLSASDTLKRLESKSICPEYINVERLSKSFVALPIPTYEKDITLYTKEDCRMYGILLGGMSVNFKNQFWVSLLTETADFVKKYLETRNIKFSETYTQRTIVIKWSGGNNFLFTSNMVGGFSAREKHLQPFFLHLPLEKSLQIFLGLAETIGRYRIMNEITIEHSSFQVIESIRYILLRAGIPSCGRIRKRNRAQNSGILSIPKVKILCKLLGLKFEKPPPKSYFIFDGKIWSPVISSERIQKVDTPYIVDLEMKRSKKPCNITANYLTSAGQAHNGGRRKGSGAIYLRPWHLDIEEFLDLKKASGPEDMRARGLFYALWISDLFMERVEKNGMWTLFCPAKAKGLDNKWGIEFEMAYEQYEAKAKAGRLTCFREIKARYLWQKIILTQIETGMPFMLYADACNRKSNQKNLGPIKSSNLCTEILEYTDKNNIASCTLGSVALNSCVINSGNVSIWYKSHIKITEKDKLRMLEQIKTDIPRNMLYNSTNDPNERSLSLFRHPDNVRYLYNEAHKKCPKWWVLRYGEYFSGETHFDFTKLEKLTGDMVVNLNHVIDRNFYPEDVPEIKSCNFDNLPLGIGVQGLADTFALLDLDWESEESKQLNKDIFETMYYAAVRKSVNLAKKLGPYKKFKGSPASKGLFQFDLWDIEADEKRLKKETAKNPEINLEMLKNKREPLDSRYDWDKLRTKMVKHGLRNSLLIALMPTASSASILSNNECFEPFTQMIYARTVLSGQFTMVNKHMVKDFQEIGMWTSNVIKNITDNDGSIQKLKSKSHPERMEFLKKKYKTAFEIPQKVLLQMSLDRGRFICQSQSFNCWMKNPSFKKLNAYHFFAWEHGAKTGMYYLRQKAKYKPIDFTTTNSSSMESVECDEEVCISCQS